MYIEPSSHDAPSRVDVEKQGLLSGLTDGVSEIFRRCSAPNQPRHTNGSAPAGLIRIGEKFQSEVRLRGLRLAGRVRTAGRRAPQAGAPATRREITACGSSGERRWPSRPGVPTPSCGSPAAPLSYGRTRSRSRMLIRHR